jgi:hypothetical protein
MDTIEAGGGKTPQANYVLQLILIGAIELMNALGKHSQFAGNCITVTERLTYSRAGTGQNRYRRRVRQETLALLQKVLDAPAVAVNVPGAIVHGIQHEHNAHRRKPDTSLHRSERDHLLWLSIIEKREVLLLQTRDTLSRCIGYQNIEKDAVLRQIPVFPLFMRAGNKRYRRSARRSRGLPSCRRRRRSLLC